MEDVEGQRWLHRTQQIWVLSAPPVVFMGYRATVGHTNWDCCCLAKALSQTPQRLLPQCFKYKSCIVYFSCKVRRLWGEHSFDHTFKNMQKWDCTCAHTIFRTVIDTMHFLVPSPKLNFNFSSKTRKMSIKGSQKVRTISLFCRFHSAQVGLRSIVHTKTHTGSHRGWKPRENRPLEWGRGKCPMVKPSLVIM